MSSLDSGCQAVYYVSPSGSDGNPGTEDAPFRTIERARDAVRAVNRGMTGDIRVLLRDGVYELERPLVFGPEDSGSGGHRVIYQSYPGESAVISGGAPVTGWEMADRGLWRAHMAAPHIRQVYVNGRRAPRAAISAPLGLEPLGLTGYRTHNNDVLQWSRSEDIEFCYTPAWAHRRCKVAAIERNGDHAVIRMQQPCFTIANAVEGTQIGYPSTVENSVTFLRSPGQWYFDRTERRLYYMPESVADTTTLDVVVPRLERLVEVRGTLDDPVHDIEFAALSFRHATWLAPSESGFMDYQAAFTAGPDQMFFLRRGVSWPGCVSPLNGEGTKTPGAVVCHAAHSVRFSGCWFTNLGGSGIDLEYGARDNVIDRCEFADISGSAIQVGDIQRHDHHPDDPRQVVAGNAVTNSLIHDAALEYKGGVGIFVGYTDGTVLAHNEIYNLPYSGISMGWGWGETDAGGGQYALPEVFAEPTPARNNRIEGNHIHHVMLGLVDGGAIYMLGNMPGTVVRGNHIHDNANWFGGIYLDEGSGHIEVTGNVVYRVEKAMNFNNRAQDRIATCPEHGNWFNVAPEAPEFPTDVAEAAGPSPTEGAPRR